MPFISRVGQLMGAINCRSIHLTMSSFGDD